MEIDSKSRHSGLDLLKTERAMQTNNKSKHQVEFSEGQNLGVWFSISKEEAVMLNYQEKKKKISNPWKAEKQLRDADSRSRINISRTIR